MTARTSQSRRTQHHRACQHSAGLAASLIALTAGVVGVAAPEAGAAPGGVYNIRAYPGLSAPIVGQVTDPNCRVYNGGGPVRTDDMVWSRVLVGDTYGWVMNDDWCI